VLVIALGLVANAIGQTILQQIGNTGWVAYAPLTNAVNEPGLGANVLYRALVWIGLISIWAAISICLLKPRRQDPPDIPDGR
jgi:heme/copper-type cytochrome/quinol oxidase subunit 1